MEDQDQKQQQPKEVLRPKTLIVQKFINLLIVVRMYMTEIPLWIWAITLVLLYALKLKRQGNLPSSILLILAMFCSVFGQYFKVNVIFLMAPLIAGLSHFISYRTYWLPGPRSLVGMREQILENDTYLMELYPIKKTQNTRKRVILWNHRLEMKRILDYEEQKGPIYRVFMKFFVSAWTKIKLILAEGDEEHCDQAFIYSHGRGATPLMSSQIITKCVSLGSQKYGVLAVQHTEKNFTGQVQMPKIKRYREIEVQVRAAQMALAVQHCKKNRKIMMGHSYGGATTVQTYHCLPQEEKKKVSHLILLDPWLFPLTDSKLKQEIHCPVLILANQYFLQIEDVYHRNIEFAQSQKKGKVVYLAWAKGDHLHQTDMGFLLGNTFKRCKNSELSLQMLDKNLKAIQMFVQEKNVTEQKMREVLKDDVLPADFKPLKWNNYLNF